MDGIGCPGSPPPVRDSVPGQGVAEPSAGGGYDRTTKTS